MLVIKCVHAETFERISHLTSTTACILEDFTPHHRPHLTTPHFILQVLFWSVLRGT